MRTLRSDMQHVAPWALAALLWLLIADVCAGVIAKAEAGELKLSTVQLRLTEAQPRSSLTVTNQAAASSLVHVRALRWSQTNGVDSFEAAPELIVNPPIAEIKPGAKQLLRVGYSGPQGSPVEGSYRLFIEEVPMVDRERTQAIETYLRISMPIFVGAPPSGTPNLILTTGEIDGKAVLLAENAGRQHVQMLAYRLNNAGSALGSELKKLQYVLPGAKVALPLPLDATSGALADSVTITSAQGELKLPIRRVTGRL